MEEVEPLVADAKRLATLLAVSLRSVRSMNASGKLPRPVRIGGRVVWRMEEIRDWLAAGAPDRAAWERMQEA
jgi:predicted DNA-binding transcriptional regulator AlpA